MFSFYNSGIDVLQIRHYLVLDLIPSSRRNVSGAVGFKHRIRTLMNMSDQVRNDGEIQKAARALFEGITPERRAELSELWTRYEPRFSLRSDSGSDGLFVLEGGRYRDVWFNHRAMRAFWLASYVAWEGYARIHDLATTETGNFEHFNQMVDVLFEMLKADDPSGVKLPDGVPEPGIYPVVTDNPSARAAAELATFATGWAFLHEIRHLQHQQEGTGAAHDAECIVKHEEELSCDEFATHFILERADEFARLHSVNADLVVQSRHLMDWIDNESIWL